MNGLLWLGTAFGLVGHCLLFVGVFILNPNPFSGAVAGVMSVLVLVSFAMTQPQVRLGREFLDRYPEPGDGPPVEAV
ncbi:hypothetical protein [Kineosporia babensis]|uniref:Uncharacterized protein n=1 Tax=Kineosporia babensis TaxID=499548 RepID=A0A9X1NDM0_9ACTN|nr:hypothetical protein [Kineosporia babensis]MCD5311331.1 hypothetical protein [Kineosporia babensis]